MQSTIESMRPGNLLRKIRRGPMRRNAGQEKSIGDLTEASSSTFESDITSSSDITLSSISLSYEEHSTWDEQAHDFPEDCSSRRVRFCPTEDSRTVESCFYMHPNQRQVIWYRRQELADMKKEAKENMKEIQTEQPQLVFLLKQCYNDAKFMAEAGLDEETLKSVGHGSLIDNLQEWAGTPDSSYCGRGLENTILRQERNEAIRESRHVVIQTALFCRGSSRGDEVVATGYREVSAYAQLYAQAVGAADAVAARGDLLSEASQKERWFL